MTPTLPQNYRKSLWIVLSILLALLVAELIAILFLNGGYFVFTLDDPYIHLSLAENLLRGHYGLNAGEFSSPSSSLLWPFLIAPFSSSSFGAYGILLLNSVFAAGTLIVFWKVLAHSSYNPLTEASQAFFTCTLIALLFTTNLVGLVYTGMEHSLQVFLSCIIVMGLIRETKKGAAPWWLFAAIAAAPWIRFECLALSLPALALLYLRGYRAKALFTAGILLGVIAAFAVFLMHLGLGPVPLSISAKSPYLNSGRGFKVAYDVLCTNLGSPVGILLALGMLFLLYVTFSTDRNKGQRGLAGVGAFAIALYLFAGQIGGYHRYEIYTVTVSLLLTLYLLREKLFTIPTKVGQCLGITLLFLTAGLLFFPYIGEVLTLPIASNNIYQQQYQMGRFTRDYYHKSVAVNDLGLVSYRNDNYVLDLWGMASKEAFDYRKSGASPTDWIPELAQKHNVEFAMIYDEWWFSKKPSGGYTVPKGWDKLGELKLGRTRITPAASSVSFYALTPAAAKEAKPLLLEFRKTLPKGVVFDLN